MKRRHRRSSGGFPPAPRSFVAVEPNDLWTVDFKGWWLTLDGTRCDPLTVRDAVSRYVIAMRVLSRCRTKDVRPVFEELFEEFGVPKAIGSDNGPPFASLRGPSYAADPVDLEGYAAPTLPAQQRACDDWITMFNHVRPHEALGQRVPAEVYRVSERRLSRCVPRTNPTGCYQVAINRHGYANCKGLHVYISYALNGWKVGLQPVAGGTTRVWFFDMLLGAFVPGRDRTVQPWVAVPDGAPGVVGA